MQRSCADVNSPYKRKCWTNSEGRLVNLVRALRYEPMREVGGGVCGGWANGYSCTHGAQINFEDLTPHLTYGSLAASRLSASFFSSLLVCKALRFSTECLGCFAIHIYDRPLDTSLSIPVRLSAGTYLCLSVFHLFTFQHISLSVSASASPSIGTPPVCPSVSAS